MTELPDELISQLLDLIDRLRDETADFLDDPGDQQQWYDRGYANGMLIALQRLGQAARLGDRMPDDEADLQGHIAMPWGKAYRHGESRGGAETYEISGNPTT